jgi:hypothetical protein
MSKIVIVDYKERTNSEGDNFFALIIEGEPEWVQSQETGKHYLTAKKTSVNSTFSEERCKQLIGTSMPGTIKKVSCESYEYTIPDTSEVITLNHTYEYQPPQEESSMEDEVFEKEKQNGAEKPALI